MQCIQCIWLFTFITPIRRTSLVMQQEIHDPVKFIKLIKEFT